jgi:hypothetical protein
MHVANRRWAIALGAALVLAVWVHSVCAAKPPRIPALYNGQLVYITVVNPNVVGVDKPAIKEVAELIYFVDGQPHVLSTIPGVPGYNPYWDIITVTVLNGRDVTTDPFLSEDEILAAYLLGDVDLSDTDIVLLCQVISK